MTNQYQYILDSSTKKFHCPNCSKKRLVRYIDNESEEYLPHNYGRCDREINCGYHINPYKDGYGKSVNFVNFVKPKKKLLFRKIRKHEFIPNEILKRTLSGYEKNVFIQNLLTSVAFPFDALDIEKVISIYYLGTVQNGYRSGAITFPFIDKNNKIRAVQVKQFDEQNHTMGTDFLHSIIEKHHTRKNEPLPEWLEAYKKNNKKVSCLFGEHLLRKYPLNPVALVEAPKTAIYGTLYFGFPEDPNNLLWLAVYNLSSLNLDKCLALNERSVYLFPDLSKGNKAFELWQNKSRQIQRQLKGSYFKVSDLLEKLAPFKDKEQGKDLADYLINIDWRLFRLKTTNDNEPT